MNVVLLECFGENMINFPVSDFAAQEAFINLLQQLVILSCLKTRNLLKHAVCLLKKN